ncbi:MAG TPA: MM0924 family protein [Ardenticatenaceae bacterium]
MEQFLAESLLNQEAELYCLGGSQYGGLIKAVNQGVVTVEFEEKETYVACDKIIAVWRRETEEEHRAAGFGFAPR